MSTASESALVVLIPEAEALVGRFRARYDPSAALGMPAHVTILYPFKSPGDLAPDVLRKLAGLFSSCPAFTAAFTQWGHFPDVLYLAPTPDEPFRKLTELVSQGFPETPPYGGQFAEIIPHLTVAQLDDPQRLHDITREFQRVAESHLPIRADVTEVALMDNEGGYWRIRSRFPLGTHQKN